MKVVCLLCDSTIYEIGDFPGFSKAGYCVHCLEKQKSDNYNKGFKDGVQWAKQEMTGIVKAMRDDYMERNG